MAQAETSDLIAPLPSSNPLSTEEMIDYGTAVNTRASTSGLIGLANQGATCYLNSLLQCLYMTPEFRHAIFHWKYRLPPSYRELEEFKHLWSKEEEKKEEEEQEEEQERQRKKKLEQGLLEQDNINHNHPNNFDDPPEYCIPYQLQCLFGRLKISTRGAVSTKPLTKSFHWDNYQLFQQHDVQELMRVLFDAVDRALERVGQTNFLSKLCRGTLLDYLDCQECHSERAREDSFLDLSLVIDRMNSLEQALSNFIEPETLSGGNQVTCTPCNKKCDFKKGLKFKTLPPLLFIQLKRFYYDWEAQRRVKLSHRVTFPMVLDMSKWTDSENRNESTQGHEELVYELYGVIIQSGGAAGGHYYAYIRSFEDGKWYNFNDSLVTELKEIDWQNAYGDEKANGTGYVLAYRRKNLPLPPQMDYMPEHLKNMAEKEDKLAREQYEKWQKEMRMITMNVYYRKDKLSKEVSLEPQVIGLPANIVMETIKVDPQEMTFQELKLLVRNIFEVSEEKVPWDRCRLRRYYPKIDFMAEGYESENIQECAIEIAKFGKSDTHLILEVLEANRSSFEYFNPNHILISLFVVTEDNMTAIVDRGFSSSSLLIQQDIPQGDFTTIIMDGTKPLDQIKTEIFSKLKAEHILPQGWVDSSKINLLRIGYQKCNLFLANDKQKTLYDFNVKLGDMLYVEYQSEISPNGHTPAQITVLEEDNDSDTEEKKIDISDIAIKSEKPESNQMLSLEEREMKEEAEKMSREREEVYRISKLARYYEEQRLKISITFNAPFQVLTPQQRIEKLVTSDGLSSGTDPILNERISFDHPVRISKEAPLGELKAYIGKKIGLNLNEFRLRKARNDQEFKNLRKSISHYNITDGGVVYVEKGLPTKPNEIRVAFTLYDPQKRWTDPWKQKKTLYRDLFEYPFDKNILVKDLKLKIVELLNQLFPPYQGKFTLIQAVNKRKKEAEKDILSPTISEKPGDVGIISLERKETTSSEISMSASISTTHEDIKEKEEKEVFAESSGPEHNFREPLSPSVGSGSELSYSAIKTPKGKLLNLFNCQHVRIRKLYGGSVKEMLFDDRALAKNLMERDEVNLAIERIDMEEYFTAQHLCFWLHRYRTDEGGVYGKVYQRKELVVGKKEKVLDLKKKIAELYKNERVRVENIIIMKGLSTIAMTAQSASRLEWFHQTILKTLPPNHGKSDEELLLLQQEAIAMQNDDLVGVPTGLHLRSGDVVVWQDITLKTPEATKEKLKKEAEERQKKKPQKNSNFKPGTSIGKGGAFEPAPLTILTHEEWQQREQLKKLEEEQKQAQAQIQTQISETLPEKNIEYIEAIRQNEPKPIILSNDEIDLEKAMQQEKKAVLRKKSV